MFHIFSSSAYRTSNWGPSDYVWSSSGYKVRRVPDYLPELYRVSSSLHMETQAKIDEFISEEFENDIRSGRQTLGPLYAVERLQEIKITLQNKLMLSRTQINKELSDWIAKPVSSHKQVMEYR